MKKISVITKVSCVVFFILSISVIIISRPIYNRLEKAVVDYTQEMKSLIYEKTGLHFSYESFSPSVLSAFYVKNIQLTDSTNRIVANIQNTKVSYKIDELFKKNYDDFIRSVTINGVVLDVNTVVTFAKMFSQNSESKKVDLNQIIDFIPQNVTVKNILLEYQDSSVETSYLVKNIALSNSSRISTIEFELESKLSLLLKNNGTKITTNVDVNAIVPSNLENSSLFIEVSDLTNGTLKMNKLNFLTTYQNNKIDARLIQSVFPLAIGAFYDLNQNQVKASVFAKDLKPAQLISTPTNKKMMNNLKDLRLNLDLDFIFDVTQKKLALDSNGNLFVPEKLVPGSVTVDFDLDGDENKLNLNYLNVSGPQYNGSVDFSLIYKTLQMSGFANIEKCILPNGNEISSQLFIDPLDKGFMIFSPQIFIGPKALTALQIICSPKNDSIDFSLEVSDYSHQDELEPGTLQIDGSYLLKSNYIQSSVYLGNLFADSIVEFAAAFLPQEKATSLNNTAQMLSPYALSADVYLSSNLKTISYNLSRLIIANTQREDQLLYVVANGNNETLQINQLQLIFAKYALEANVSLDKMIDSNEMFFTANILSSSIPYHFSGTIMPEVINISGDYGFDVQVQFDSLMEYISGHVLFDNFPIAFGSSSFIFSSDIGFDFTKENGPSVQIRRFSAEEAGPVFQTNPKLEFAGNATKYGAQINYITYSDLYSYLEGQADVTININQSILDSVGLNLNLTSQISDESISVDANVSNPDRKVLDSSSLSNSLYINAAAFLTNFNLNRFMRVKNDNNKLTGSVSLSGTLDQPYASLSVEKASVLLTDELMNLNGNVILVDKDLIIERFEMDYKDFNVSDFKGSFSIQTMEGQMSAVFNTKGQKTLTIPMQLKLHDAYIPENSKVPQALAITLESEKITGSLMKKDVPFSLTALWTKDEIAFFSSPNIGLMGNIYDGGKLSAYVESGDIAKFNVSGELAPTNANIKISDIKIDLAKLMSYIDIDEFFIVNHGIAKGSVSLLGDLNAPDFKGAVSITDPRFKIPILVSKEISTEKMLFTVSNNEIQLLENVYFMQGEEKFRFAWKIFMNKWLMDHFEMNLRTLQGVTIPLDFKSPYVNLKGDVKTNLNLYMEKNLLELTGDVIGENVDIVSKLADISSTENTNANPDMIVRTNLKVYLGTHVTLALEPLLRCVLVPNTFLTVKIDTSSQIYEVDGKINLKSGDIAYLNRNFYIREGSIKFNPQNIANPLLSIQAEVRERDSEGENVRIILSAQNQYLLDFNPKFSSIPIKSEREIRELLGQIVLADSQNVSDLIFAASDYYIQSTVGRSIENKLREILNFDILSIRTNVLQNAFTLGTESNSFEKLTLGNFLDNSTVYIGKYLGSALYVDAMLHISVPNKKVYDIYDMKHGVIFQPEIGLELDSPFGNIRWNMAPDINALLNNQYVPSTSITLSWKVTF